MTVQGNVTAQIQRLGREADVYVRSETGENEFGNTTDDHTYDRTVLAFRTTPNRNTEREATIGDRGEDESVFIVPIGGNNPEPPQYNDQIEYQGRKYEVGPHTEYDTHVEFFGELVIHDESGE
jgi:hypothetical protein